MLNQQYAFLTSTDTYIEPLLTHILEINEFGIYRGRLEVDSISSSCDKLKGDRFKLSIPYATQNLIWDVFFDSQCPKLGPDFIFNDDSFLADMDADTLSNKLPSLAKWNPNNRNALLNVLVELLSCYKQHQVQLLQKQDRLLFEYTMLEKSTEVQPEDIEMVLLPIGSKPTEARFLINLQIDVSQLQNRSSESESDTATLLVTFYGADWNRIVPQLNFSKSLQEVLNVHLPHFPPNKCLIDYIQEIKKYIAEEINSIVQSVKMRKELVSAILCLRGHSVIEYDPVQYTFIMLLLSKEDFSVLLQIKLLPGFPVEKPILQLISIYHMIAPRTPYTEIIQDFQYDSQWTQMYIAKKLLAHIEQNINDFKCSSIRNCFS